MKIFRHTNGNLYSIEQRGSDGCITPHPKAHYWYGIPYKTNKNIDVLEIGPNLDLDDFNLEFEI